ncbi:MAG: hypothetical protein R6V39_09615 [Desulfovibrionales bacterium]
MHSLYVLLRKSIRKIRLIPWKQKAKKPPTEAKEAMPTGHPCRPQNGQTEKAA